MKCKMNNFRDEDYIENNYPHVYNVANWIDVNLTCAQTRLGTVSNRIYIVRMKIEK